MSESYRSGNNCRQKSLQLALAHLATRQHGPFHRDQVIELGFEEDHVDYAVKIRRFHPVYPEVYIELSRKRSLTVRQLERLLERHKGERGTRLVREVLARQRTYDGFSNGGYEDAFWEWLHTLRLPEMPKRNVNVLLKDGTTRQVDLLLRKQIIELHHYPHHGGDRRQTTIDLQRHRALREAGYDVDYFTSDEFLDDLDRVERDARRLLEP